MSLPMSPRTAAGEQAYQDAKLTPGALKALSDEPSLQEWSHWRLIDNRFPYGMIYRQHHMLIPKREVAHRNDLNVDELRELKDILTVVEEHYDLVFDNMQKRRSILNHYHLHLASYHETREAVSL